MATTIQDLEERVDALYNSVLQMQQNLNPVIEKTDNTSNTVSNTVPQVNTNTSGINENSGGILDIAELADENSMAITDIADYTAELEARIEELEGKVNG